MKEHHFANLPDELRQYQNWILWRYEDKGGSKPSKIPYAVQGGNAKTNDPTTWSSYADTLAAFERGGYHGIGFVFTNTPFVGIDIDDLEEGGAIPTELAVDITNLNSYRESSPSGTGIHVILKGKLPAGRRRNGKFEMYGQGSNRYFTMTGVVNTVLPVRECQAEIDAFHAKYIAKQEVTPADMGNPITPLAIGGNDEESFRIGLERDDRLKALYAGSREQRNESADDMALFDKLAYWCNGNRELMRWAFLQSPHYAQKDEQHRKKCARKDYIDRTIEEALADLRTTAALDHQQWQEQRSKTTLPKGTPDESKEAPPPKLQALSAVELMGRDLGEVMFLVVGFLHQGLAVLSADPKIGKSWFALDLCLSIATGTPFLDYETVQAGALYLALEDSWRRLQSRMRKVMQSKGIEPPSNFYLATAANPLDMGLTEQLDEHMKAHPDTKLIVIDVLERIRSGNAPRNKNAYQIDSAEIGRIKAIADKYNICVFLVHHNRKMRDASDPFLNMSGSQGIVSSVDEGFTLSKEKREDVRATLNIISREMGDEKLVLEFDRGLCRWKRVGTFEEQEQQRSRREYDDDPVVKTIKGLLSISPAGIELKASELADFIPQYGGVAMDVRTIGLTINRHKANLFNYDKIVHHRGTTKNKKHSFRSTLDTHDTLDPLDTHDTLDTGIELPIVVNHLDTLENLEIPTVTA